MADFEISVVLVTYNAIKEKLLATLDSILLQENVKFEIVVADDGSKENHFPLIKDYFKEKRFIYYQLVGNSANRGTVKNFYSGVVCSRGKYIKGISPGDELTNSKVLKKWLQFNLENDFRWSFSDAIYYECGTFPKKIICAEAHPQNVSIYEKGKTEFCRWSYLVLRDIPIGAAILSDKEIMQLYLEKIIGTVVYAEDHIWRMMMFDGIVGGYYSANTVLYELGSGISTGKNNVWRNRLGKDWDRANELMKNQKGLDKFQCSVIKAWKKEDTGRIKKIFIRGKIVFFLKKKFFMRKTQTMLK